MDASWDIRSVRDMMMSEMLQPNKLTRYENDLIHPRTQLFYNQLCHPFDRPRGPDDMTILSNSPIVFSID